MKFMFQDENGNPSLRKIIAGIFILLAIVEKAKLVFWTPIHFSVYLEKLGVSDAVIIALIASVDAMAVLCLTVYGITKSGKGAKAETKPEVTSEQD